MQEKETEQLRGRDYMTRNPLELQSHPDFSPHALRVVTAIGAMTNEQLESLDLISAVLKATKKGN